MSINVVDKTTGRFAQLTSCCRGASVVWNAKTSAFELRFGAPGKDRLVETKNQFIGAMRALYGEMATDAASLVRSGKAIVPFLEDSARLDGDTVEALKVIAERASQVFEGHRLHRVKTEAQADLPGKSVMSEQEKAIAEQLASSSAAAAGGVASHRDVFITVIHADPEEGKQKDRVSVDDVKITLINQFQKEGSENIGEEKADRLATLFVNSLQRTAISEEVSFIWLVAMLRAAGYPPKISTEAVQRMTRELTINVMGDEGASRTFDVAVTPEVVKLFRVQGIDDVEAKRLIKVLKDVLTFLGLESVTEKEVLAGLKLLIEASGHPLEFETKIDACLGDLKERVLAEGTLTAEKLASFLAAKAPESAAAEAVSPAAPSASETVSTAAVI